MDWNKYDNKRKPFFKSSKKDFKTALKKQIDPFLSEMNKAETTARMIAFAENYFVSELPIKAAYKKTFNEAGVTFATIYFREFSKKKADVDETVFQAYFNRFVEEECGQLISEVTDYTKEQIVAATKQAVEIGVNEGWSFVKIAKQITMKLDKMTEYRAERIARTEVVRASNKGSLIGVQSTGLDLNKRWVSAGDHRVRDGHQASSISVVDIKEDFIVRGESLAYPCDSKGSASNTVHCRCSLVYEEKI